MIAAMLAAAGSPAEAVQIHRLIHARCSPTIGPSGENDASRSPRGRRIRITGRASGIT